MERIIRIGLTGGIAAGKSTVAGHLRESGVAVVDYDELARRVVEPGGEGLRRIAAEFGPGCIGADGRLDRAWMAERVFGPDAAPDARERLDAIEHPLIYAEAARAERGLVAVGCGGVVVHDVPLLAEVLGDMPFAFDHIVTVEAPERTRVERMMATRGMTRGQAEGRIRHQSTRAEREAVADVVIDSTRPMEQMFESIDTLVARWRGEAERARQAGPAAAWRPRA